ncbi:MAG: NfeD family protein, partial [Pseudomonadota bacterium]
GTAGFLLGAGVAALGMGAVLVMAPGLSISWQIVLYAISSVLATIVYFKLFRDAQRVDKAPLLNRRAKRLIGEQFTLSEDINGTARVQIGDTMWKVNTDEPLRKGTLVEVIDARRMSLVIAAK